MLCFTVPYQRNVNIIRFCCYYILFKSRTITGGIDQNIQSTTIDNDFRIQGAFGQTQAIKGAGGAGNNNAWALSNLRFRASDSSSLYSSNIVQPQAAQTLMIIKV